MDKDARHEDMSERKVGSARVKSYGTTRAGKSGNALRKSSLFSREQEIKTTKDGSTGDSLIIFHDFRF